jgi:hypothetical protein
MVDEYIFWEASSFGKHIITARATGQQGIGWKIGRQIGHNNIVV